MGENTKSIFPTDFVGQRVLGKDPTVWLNNLKSNYEFGKVII